MTSQGVASRTDDVSPRHDTNPARRVSGGDDHNHEHEREHEHEPDTLALAHGRRRLARGGLKAGVVRLITNKPCLSFAVTLLAALVLGGLGLGLGGMSIETEGWETRGGAAQVDREVESARIRRPSNPIN